LGSPIKRHLSREKSISTVRGVSSSPSVVRIGVGVGGQDIDDLVSSGKPLEMVALLFYQGILSSPRSPHIQNNGKQVYPLKNRKTA